MKPRSAWGPLVCLAVGGVLPGADASDAVSQRAEPFVLSVRNMVLAHDVNTDDTMSPNPDLFVRIARTDPEVAGEIRRLEEVKDRLNSRYRDVKRRLDRLRTRQAESEVERETVEPLTGVQVERLTTLLLEVGSLCMSSRKPCRGCPEKLDFDTCYACAKCPELQLLQWKKDQSELVATAPLTEDELRLLNRLEEEASRLDSEVAAKDQAATRLRRLIRGSSATVETPSRRVDFGDREVIKVYPGDEITVSVGTTTSSGTISMAGQP